jgi:hypothetical protein
VLGRLFTATSISDNQGLSAGQAAGNGQGHFHDAVHFSGRWTRISDVRARAPGGDGAMAFRRVDARTVESLYTSNDNTGGTRQATVSADG